MIIKEIVEGYKSLNEKKDIDIFFTELFKTEEFQKTNYDPKDVDDTFKYLKRRDEILKIVNATGWKYVSQNVELPLEFIREFSNKLNWGKLSYNIPYDEKFIDEFANMVNWKVLFLKYTFSESFLYKHQDHIRYAIVYSDSN